MGVWAGIGTWGGGHAPVGADPALKPSNPKPSNPQTLKPSFPPSQGDEQASPHTPTPDALLAPWTRPLRTTTHHPPTRKESVNRFSTVCAKLAWFITSSRRWAEPPAPLRAFHMVCVGMNVGEGFGSLTMRHSDLPGWSPSPVGGGEVGIPKGAAVMSLCAEMAPGDKKTSELSTRNMPIVKPWHVSKRRCTCTHAWACMRAYRVALPTHTHKPSCARPPPPP
jgi:hypothetical protein